MLNSVGWVPLALFGALVYGSYSLMLMMVHDKIRKDKIAQVGYSLIFSICFGIIITPIYFLYFNVHHKEKANIVLKYIDWKIVLALLVIGLSIGPVHVLVMNAGGSIGQQTMMSLSIVPTLIGSWLFFGQVLNIKQWIGLILAGVGAFLMGSK